MSKSHCLTGKQTKKEVGPKSFAKRSDQIIRDKWDDIENPAVKEENDRYEAAIRYMGTFPQKEDNKDLLIRLIAQQKEHQAQMTLMEAMIDGHIEENVYCGVNL